MFGCSLPGSGCCSAFPPPRYLCHSLHCCSAFPPPRYLCHSLHCYSAFPPPRYLCHSLHCYSAFPPPSYPCHSLHCCLFFFLQSGSDGEFFWNKSEQGLILGAFFYGYITTQVLGGWLAENFGGKHLYGLGILCTAALTLLTPIAARADFKFLIAVRVLEGVGEVCICRRLVWTNERNTFGAFVVTLKRFIAFSNGESLSSNHLCARPPWISAPCNCCSLCSETCCRMRWFLLRMTSQKATSGQYIFWNSAQWRCVLQSGHLQRHTWIRSYDLWSRDMDFNKTSREEACIIPDRKLDFNGPRIEVHGASCGGHLPAVAWTAKMIDWWLNSCWIWCFRLISFDSLHTLGR